LLESLISVASVSLRRKRAEEHEKKQGEFMKTVLNSLQSPLYVVDKGFNVVLGNEAAKKRGIVDGGQCHRVAHQTEKTCNDTHVCPLKEVVRTGKSMMAEHLHTDKDGNAKTFEVHGDPIFGKDGEVVQMIEYSIDVTERKKMEEDLRESEKRFRELAELLPETVFETDPKGTLTFANRKAFDHFGYAPEELAKGLNVLDLVAPEDRKRAFENMQNVMNGETLGLNEFTMVRKSGSRFPSTIHSTAILKGGNPSGLRGFVMDITSRKTMEAALKESEQKFRDIFMHSPDPISIHATEDGKCVEINAAFTQLSGHSQNEAMGRTTAELELWENPDDRLRFLERMRKEGEVKNMETVFLTKDGTEKPCLISAYLIDLQGKKHIVSMVKDLSDLRRVEREKESIRKQLIQSQKMEMIGQLAGGIAHDFNNILTVIGGNSDIGMESTSPNDPLHEFFREILNASKNASSLTRKLLAFSRQQHLREERVNLKEIFPGLEKMLKRIIGEDIKPSFSANPDLWAIKIDPSQLENVIINLAINARDGINERRQSRRDEKTPPKPFVGILAVSAHNCALDKAEADTMPDMLPGPHVRIDVEDNGCGISEENLQKIFTPFFTTKAVGKGTGLGLASVMGTVLQSRGGIQVRSTVGEGTRFSMFFPRLQEATPAPAALPGKKEALKSSKTILLVEDDESVGKSTQRMLEQFGHTVLLANDPNEALSLFDKRSDEIDLIISDMKMPHLTGPELVELVRTKKPVKVLFMSGYPEEHFNKGEGTNDEFIAKPFGVSDLSKKLQGIFDEKDKK
jgi:PAS domain S-box-containing protein